MNQHSNEYDPDHIYEVPQYGDGMKPNDYEHYYEPTAANWFIYYNVMLCVKYCYLENTTMNPLLLSSIVQCHAAYSYVYELLNAWVLLCIVF